MSSPRHFIRNSIGLIEESNLPALLARSFVPLIPRFAFCCAFRLSLFVELEVCILVALGSRARDKIVKVRRSRDV